MLKKFGAVILGIVILAIGLFAAFYEYGKLAVANSDPVINYLHVWGYPGGQLDPGGSIQRGGKVRMYAGVSDLETASDLLNVIISYRVENGSWTMLSAAWQSSYGYWYVDWVIPSDAASGLYDVGFVALDGDGGSASLTEAGAFFVVSNSDPVVNSLSAWGYPSGPLDPGGVVSVGTKVRMYSYVSDAETASADLPVTIGYKAQVGSDWTNATATWESHYGYWYVDWVVPSGATSGLYDVFVEVSDGDGGSAVVTEAGEFAVIS